MTIKLEWTKDDACRVGAQEFPLSENLPPMREVGEAARTLREYAEAWALLRKAELSFETGGASYENAWANARNLKASLAEVAAGKGFQIRHFGTRCLDGIADEVPLYEVVWQESSQDERARTAAA